jgi:hypothetical protein
MDNWLLSVHKLSIVYYLHKGYLICKGVIKRDIF